MLLDDHMGADIINSMTSSSDHVHDGSMPDGAWAHADLPPGAAANPLHADPMTELKYWRSSPGNEASRGNRARGKKPTTPPAAGDQPVARSGSIKRLGLLGRRLSSGKLAT